MKLVVLDGPMKGEQFPITKSPTIIGRARGADVCLPLDPLMSRFHAQVVKQGDSMLIEDMGSGNGTYLAGRRLEQATPFRGIL